MDWATRHVLSWRLSNTMDAGFCAEAATRWPAIGRRYSIRIRAASTSLDFTGVPRTRASAISMDLGAAAWTTSSSSACGGLSSMTCELTDGFHAERVIGEWRLLQHRAPHSSSTVKRRPRPTGPVNLWMDGQGSPLDQQQQQDVIKRILAACQTTEYTLTGPVSNKVGPPQVVTAALPVFQCLTGSRGGIPRTSRSISGVAGPAGFSQ